MSTMTGASSLMGATGKSKPKVPSGYKYGQFQKFTPEQMELFHSLFSHLMPGSYLSRLAGGDEALFKEIEAPAFRQFGQTLGGIASRFSGAGMGGQKSNAFQLANTAAGKELAEGLQAQRMGLQSQALRDLMSMSQGLLQQNPYEQFLTPKKESFLEKLFGGLSGGIGSGLGQFGSMWGGKKFGLF